MAADPGLPSVYFKYFAELDKGSKHGYYSAEVTSFVISGTLQDYSNSPTDNLTQIGDISPDAFFAYTNEGTFEPRYFAKLVNGRGVTTDYGGGHTFLYSTDKYTAGTILELDQSAYQITCFRAGTLIRADLAGEIVEVPIDMLQVGDIVVTSSGAKRPIKWLGHRTMDCRKHPRRQEALPIRIAAHAFGGNLPARDLYVSPGHSICVDLMGETLIPAGALVNGTTIAQVEVETVTYWHVELETHDILLAENLPAESYLEMGNRRFFADADVIDLAAGPDAPTRTHAHFCRPFVDRGPLLDAVRTWLAGRADALEAERGQTPAVAERLAS